MSEHKDHISTYKSHVVVLLSLILLTILTVTITSVHLGPFNTAAAYRIRESFNRSALFYAPEVRPKDIPVHGYACTCYLLSRDHHHLF
jgi:hypothetical protein